MRARLRDKRNELNWYGYDYITYIFVKTTVHMYMDGPWAYLLVDLWACAHARVLCTVGLVLQQLVVLYFILFCCVPWPWTRASLHSSLCGGEVEPRARRAMGYSEPYCTYIVYCRDYINLFLVLDGISNLETAGKFREFRLIFHFRIRFEYLLSLGGECGRVAARRHWRWTTWFPRLWRCARWSNAHALCWGEGLLCHVCTGVRRQEGARSMCNCILFGARLILFFALFIDRFTCVHTDTGMRAALFCMRAALFL